MNINFLRIAGVALLIGTSALNTHAQISGCYTEMAKAGKLKRTTTTRFTEPELTQQLPTGQGTVTITAVDAYHLQYNEKKETVPFVSVQIQESAPGAYESDRQKVMANLAYSRRQVDPREPQRPVVLDYNGYKLYGYGAADERNIDNRFVMFPGNGVIVCFHFQAPDPRDRSYEQVQDYLARRNSFMGQYTSCINRCFNQ